MKVTIELDNSCGLNQTRLSQKTRNCSVGNSSRPWIIFYILHWTYTREYNRLLFNEAAFFPRLYYLQNFHCHTFMHSIE